jgi:CubicO group peptidase (beta-lactamase class C family)
VRWMRPRRLLAVLGVAVAVAAAGVLAVRGQPARPAAVAEAGAPAAAAPSLDALQGRVRAILDRYGVPGAGIVLADRQGVLWSGGVGVADRATGRPVTAGTPFRLGSVSKSVTALAVMQLVESGRLSLDARLRDLAPEVSFDNPWEATDPVTVADLLEHTAGFEFAHFNEYFDDRSSPRSLLAALAVNPASRHSRWPPGTRMSYSNEGYLVAGYLIEKLTGRSFDDVVRDGILAPLGMGTAAFRLTPQIDAIRARGYGEDGSPSPYLEDMMRPAANLLASPDDMGRYLLMMLNRGELDGTRLLSPAGIDRMEERRTLPYAGPAEQYGLGTDTAQYDGHVAHGHTGYTDGFRASLRYFPREGVGWTLMLNSSSVRADQARVEIENELAGYLLRGSGPPPQPASTVVSGSALGTLAGYYRDVTPDLELGAPLLRLFSGEELRVRQGVLWERTVGGGGLLSLLQRSPWQPLTAVGAGAFRRDGESISSLYFTRAPGGGEVLVTPAGYMEKDTGWWLMVLERAAFVGALLVLISAILMVPLWLVPALLGGHPGHLWARALPAAAALALLVAYALLSKAPQPLGEVNPATVAICALSCAFAALSVLALVAALRAASDQGSWFVRAHSLLAAGSCVGLTLFAWSAGWIALRTWT